MVWRAGGTQLSHLHYRRGRKHADKITWQYGFNNLSQFASSRGTATEKMAESDK